MADVEVKFGASVEGVQEAVDSVREKIEGLTAPIEAVSESFSKLGEAMIAGFAVEKLEHFVESMGEFGEQTEHLAAQLGLGAEEITRLGYAAAMAGVSQEGMAHGLERLSYNMQMAQKGGNEQAAAFQALGISQEFLSQHSNDLNAVLGQVADAFQRSADGPAKTAIAIELFGRAGAELIPILDKGRAGLAELGMAADRAGVVLSGAMAEHMAETHEHMVEFGQAAKGAGITLFTDFEPAIDAILRGLTELVEDFNNNLKAVGPLRDGVMLLTGAFDVLVSIVELVSTTLEETWEVFAGTLQSVEVGLKAVVSASNDALHGRMSEAISDFDVGAGQIESIWKERVGKMDAATDGFAESMKKLWTPLLSPAPANPYTGGTAFGGDTGEEQKPQLPSTGQVANKDQEDDSWMEVYREQARMSEDAAKQELERQKVEAQGEIEIQRDKLGAYKDSLAEQVADGKMTYDQMIDLVKQRTDEEYQLEMDALDKEWAGTQGNVVAYQRVFQEIEALKAKHVQDMAALDDQEARHNEDAAKKTEQAWEQALRPIGNVMEQTVMGMITRSETLQQAEQRIVETVLGDFLRMAEQMLMKWVATEIAKTAATEAGNSIRMMSSETAAEHQAATDAAAAGTSILNHAYSAAAAVYDDVSQIPYVGWILAPPAAAVAFAAVAAFGSGIQSYDVGTDYVPYTGLAMIHQGERILTVAENAAISSGGRSGGVGSLAAPNFHFHIDTPDQRGVRQLFMDNHEHVADAMKKAWRNSGGWRGR